MKKFSLTYLDVGIKYSLIPYLTVIFILTALGSWQAFLTHNTWHIGDWLINYQGGFVRRGLLGEFIYQLSSYTTVSPGFYVFLIQILFNSLFLLFSFLLLKKQKSILPYMLLICSPFLFTFQINSFDHIESQGGYFKESIYCFLLAFIGWFAVSYKAKIFEIVFYLVLILYPLAILTHESFAIFLPFLLIVYVTKIELNTKRFMILLSLLCLSVVSFVLCLIFPGNKAQVTAIYNSLIPQYPVSTYGSIGWLMIPVKDAAERVLIQVNYNHYFKNYGLILFLSLIAFVPVFNQLKFIFKNKLSCFLLLISLIGTILLCTIAIDWGRFIRINLVSLFILSLVSGVLYEQENRGIKYSFPIGTRLFFIASLVFTLGYALLWRIPNCCNYRPPVSNFETNNLAWSYQAYKKVISQIVQSINRV